MTQTQPVDWTKCLCHKAEIEELTPFSVTSWNTFKIQHLQGKINAMYNYNSTGMQIQRDITTESVTQHIRILIKATLRDLKGTSGRKKSYAQMKDREK